MKSKAPKVLVLFTVLMLLVAAFGASAREQEPLVVAESAVKAVEAVEAADEGVVIEPKGATGEAVYIVRLQDAPLAAYRGGVKGLNATSPAATGAENLNMNSPAALAYVDHLAEQQAVFLSSAERLLRRSVDVLYQYDVSYNGVALILSPSEASAVAKQSGVVTVTRDQWRYPLTDVTPEFLNAVSVWDGSGVSGAGTRGEGIIVGVVDTGIWPEHPSFADDGSFSAPPAGWGGTCEAPADGTDPLKCNNKLIGARYRLDGYNFAVGGYDGLFNSARDDNGHGTHTTSTAAGNENVEATLLGVDRGMISGIAPRAHVAAYKGLGPQGGVTSDLVAAIEAAVSDGVDVINYSVGGGASNPWSDPDALAFLAAREAGVFVATSAGNAGPGSDTIGSPGNAPWITTVGASTSNREFISDITLSGPGSPPQGLFGASLTAGVNSFDLVDAEGIADQGGDATGRCINPYPAGTFQATDVVLCKRGEVARVVRGDNVKAGGGGGVILYNADSAQGLSTDNYVIPAVHVTYDTGLAIKGYLASSPGQVKISFTDGQKAYAASDSRVVADMMAAFSSRGPNGTLVDLIKPDVTAPGVQILAGNSPQCSDPSDACGAPNQLFQAIQGTSMSSPHVAGAAALVAAHRPDWTPAEIESALMTTSVTGVVKEDGTTPADAFDMGAGRIDITKAANAPLILDEIQANYVAANPNAGGDPKSLNIASMANSHCVNGCSWTRVVENSSGETLTWDAAVNGIPGTVEPASFNLAPGAKQTLKVTVNVTGLNTGEWAFATLLLDPRKDGIESSHMPIAVIAELGSLPETVEINTRRDAGSYLLEDLTAAEITNMTLMAYGLVPANDHIFYLMQDESKDLPYDDLGQVWYKTINVPAGAARFVGEILESEAEDADLFVGRDSNGNGMPEESEQLCESVTASWREYCSFDNPEAGIWWVMVQNYKSSGAEPDKIRLGTAVVVPADAGNLDFESPAAVPALEPFDLGLVFDLEQTFAGQAWYGAFLMGSDAQHPGNIGRSNINLYRHENDVVKSADKVMVMPGDKVEFTIKVNSNLLNEDVGYTVVDMIPDGMTYVAGSATADAGNVVVSGNKLSWSGTLASKLNYTVSTSEDDPQCQTPFVGGGYVDLAASNIYPQSTVTGNGKLYFITDGPFEFFGKEYTQIYFSDDGYLLFDADNNYTGATGNPQAIPNPTQPNNLLAGLWQDMEIVYSQALNKGFTYAKSTDDVLRILEFDDVQLVGESTESYDYEVIIRREVDSTPGAYEIMYVYDNLKGDLSGPVTVGVENAPGDLATAFINSGSAAGSLKDDLVICFDWSNLASDVTITYEATIDGDVTPGVLMNTASSKTDNAGSKETFTSAGVYVGYPLFSPAIPIKQ